MTTEVWTSAIIYNCLVFLCNEHYSLEELWLLRRLILWCFVQLCVIQLDPFSSINFGFWALLFSSLSLFLSLPSFSSFSVDFFFPSFWYATFPLQPGLLWWWEFFFIYWVLLRMFFPSPSYWFFFCLLFKTGCKGCSHCFASEGWGGVAAMCV